MTEFGAFVDIGAGRDGLVHISELSVGRVSNVKDIVEEGQTVTVWIKRLNRERNRISLTMISPDTKTIRDLQRAKLSRAWLREWFPMVHLSILAWARMRSSTSGKWEQLRRKA